MQQSWREEEHKLEQVPLVKYIGVVSHSTGTWNMHQNHVVQKALRSASAIQHFFYASRGQLIPVALKHFEAKPLTQILYGVQVGIYEKKNTLETAQMKILRLILSARME